MTECFDKQIKKKAAYNIESDILYKLCANLKVTDTCSITGEEERKDSVRHEHVITVQEKERGHQKRKSLLIEAYQTDSPGPSFSSFCQHHRKGHLP